MAPKAKAIKIVYSDQSEGWVHAPTFPEFQSYLRVLPILRKFSEVVAESAEALQGDDPIIGKSKASLSPSEEADVNAFLAQQSGLTDAEMRALPYADGNTILVAFLSLLPKNQEATQPDSATTPV